MENKTKVTKSFFSNFKGNLLNKNCVKIPNLRNRKYSENTVTFKVKDFNILSYGLYGQRNEDEFLACG